MTWWGNWGPRPRIIFKRFNTAPLQSFNLIGPKFKLWNFSWHASWKRIYKTPITHCSSHISKIVWWLPMFDFGIFCHLLRLMGIIRWGPRRPGIWKVSFSFLFSLFFSFLHFFLLFFFFFGSLSGALSPPGPGDIVNPCHPVATPLSTLWPISYMGKMHPVAVVTT